MIDTSHPETVTKLHVWRTCCNRVLKRIAFITYELDISWDPDIGAVFVGDDLSRHTACLTRAPIDYSWSITKTSPASITVVQTWCINIDFLTTILTWLRIRYVVQFNSVVLAICYLQLHSLKMNIFKLGRIDGDHSAIAFIFVSLFVSLFLIPHQLWWKTSSCVGLYKAKFVFK